MLENLLAIPRHLHLRRGLHRPLRSRHLLRNRRLLGHGPLQRWDRRLLRRGLLERGQLSARLRRRRDMRCRGRRNGGLLNHRMLWSDRLLHGRFRRRRSLLLLLG